MFSLGRNLRAWKPAIILGERLTRWRWSRGYVDNVAAAIAQAVTDTRATGRIYHVCEEPTLTEMEWVQAIGEAAGWDGTIVTLPEEHLARKINISQDLVYDITRIRQELEYREPIPLDEALKETIAWQRANSPGEVDANLFDYALEDAVLAERA